MGIVVWGRGKVSAISLATPEKWTVAPETREGEGENDTEKANSSEPQNAY